MFPQQINAAASFNRDLVRAMGDITGRDTNAAGIPWIFGPILDVQSAKIWPRVYETFGEDPYVVTELGREIVTGLQANNTIAACFKHFIGYAATPTGHDRDPLTLSDYDVLNYYMPPFKAAIDAGAMTGMMNYVSLNGKPMGVNHKMLVKLLRHDLAFEGMLVTDWGVINDLQSFHHVAATQEDAVRMTLTHTSIDMSMVASDTLFINHTQALLDAKKVTVARLRESVKRITTLKLKLNLYETSLPGESNVNTVGDAKSQSLALALASESIVLLKNTNRTLPLLASKKNPSIFLTGPSIANVGHLCGGWSLAWQGVGGNDGFPNGQSVQDALRVQCPSCDIQSMPGVDVSGNYSADVLADAVKKAAAAEFTIAVIGEGTYAEKPGDINDLTLARGQQEYVRALAKTSTKLILVLVQGRPRLLNGLADVAHAVVNAMLPCELGGKAIASILLGSINPSGKLPFTYPKSMTDSTVPYYHPQNQGCVVDGVFGDCPHEWTYGSGLSYTTFNYSNMSLAFGVAHVDVNVTVANMGAMDGKESVLLFVRQSTREDRVPEAKRLIKFDKIELKAGANKIVSFRVTDADLGIYTNKIGKGLKKTITDGDYVFMFKAETDCNTVNLSLCKTFASHHVSSHVWGL
ncbi:Aste57867_11722 [Aphanomyces stellatus]|uniref:beta-glucosidase n=1 Tax=Aphanomyces stellatus TaxID=120398 RepID=A0A485KTQ5_9STRA|nr:hypothetical protein As57867_011679 [Aphanomyces stellatus]VFT88579.1 Aste57867_11722 [Aphanomyces stellatus]